MNVTIKIYGNVHVRCGTGNEGLEESRVTMGNNGEESLELTPEEAEAVIKAVTALLHFLRAETDEGGDADEGI